MSKLISVETKALGPLQVKRGDLLAGQITLARAKVTLQIGVHYSPIQGRLLLSPEGADAANRIAGLSVVVPPGQSRADQHDDYGYTYVRRRVIVVGYAPTGKLVVVDYSAALSPRAYFIRSLLARLKDSASAGYLGSPDHAPADKSRRWRYISLGEDGGLWIDLGHPDVFRCYESYMQDRQFADRRCLGIARRNALCMHPGFVPKVLGTYVPRRDPRDPWAGAPRTLEVPVWFFRSARDEAASVAESFINGDAPPQGVEVRTEEREASPEDLESAEVIEEGAVLDDHTSPPAGGGDTKSLDDSFPESLD